MHVPSPPPPPPPPPPTSSALPHIYAFDRHFTLHTYTTRPPPSKHTHVLLPLPPPQLTHIYYTPHRKYTRTLPAPILTTYTHIPPPPQPRNTHTYTPPPPPPPTNPRNTHTHTGDTHTHSPLLPTPTITHIILPPPPPTPHRKQTYIYRSPPPSTPPPPPVPHTKTHPCVNDMNQSLPAAGTRRAGRR